MNAIQRAAPAIFHVILMAVLVKIPVMDIVQDAFSMSIMNMVSLQLVCAMGSAMVIVAVPVMGVVMQNHAPVTPYVT